jgi:hypothetical protein
VSGSAQCPHLEFDATVNVARIEDTGLKYAHLAILCRNCGKPAKFRGMKWGLSPDEPRAAVGDEQANLPFLCEGDAYNGKGMSYSITRFDNDH